MRTLTRAQQNSVLNVVHVIRKQQTPHCALYAGHWKAPVEPRGLEGRGYDVVDYVNGTKFGTVSGHNAT